MQNCTDARHSAWHYLSKIFAVAFVTGFEKNFFEILSFYLVISNFETQFEKFGSALKFEMAYQT